MKTKSVSERNIKDFLVSIGQISEKEKKDTDIDGTAGDYKASMSTYVTLKGILGDTVIDNEKLCEDIVLWHTLNTDKSVVENLIMTKYGNIPEVANNIRALKGLVFKEFGKLSKELLCGISGGVDENTGEVYTILGELYKTNKNLNELVWSDEYTFQRSIDETNGVASPEVTYEDVEDLYVSPAVRRGIWQALCMCDEYIEAVGRKPDKIFVEVTRAAQKDKKGKPTESRKQRLEKMYAKCDGIDDLKERLKQTDDVRLRQERLYLYFLQLGRCMYSGDIIKLDELMSDQYDIDHIIPRSLRKTDNGLDNKVLVKSVLNRNKKDRYPIPEFCRPIEAVALWERLKTKGLISERKYKRLIRRNPLTNEELAEFVAWQIVFTGQAAKATAELLKRKYENDGKKVIYYSKAANVSDFRKKFGFIKCRETNDLHHARDAYLNIVVGNVYDARFGSLYRDLKRGKPIISENAEEKLFENNVLGAWNKYESIDVVKRIMYKSSMCVTYYTVTQKGKFYDETVYSEADKGNIPRKEKTPLADTLKYGGYKSIKTAYFAIVESSGKKGARIKTLEAIPTLVYYKIGTDINKLLEYLISKGMKDPVIMASPLKKYSLLKYNGTPVLITGISGQQITISHTVQWFTDNNTDKYIKAILKCHDDISNNLRSADREEYIVNDSRNNEGIKINAKTNTVLYDKAVAQLSHPIYGGLSGMKNFRANLESKRSLFAESSVSEQINSLIEIIKFLNGRKGTSDLTSIGLSKNAGKLLIGQNITNERIEIIHISPCGLHTVIRKIN